METGPDAGLRVAVIGGGFTGACFAVQLARQATFPVSISILEPRPALGAGVAYSTPDPAHRLNVPAARMTLFADDPGHFERWLRARGELAADPEAICGNGDAYPRRAAFGRYMAALVADTQRSHPHAVIEHIQDTACSIIRESGRWRITGQSGAAQAADIVILAASHPPPSVPPALLRDLADDHGVITNPWPPAALDDVRPQDDVLIIGTGLSMADVVASLSQRGHHGSITAFSRRGLLSRGHCGQRECTAIFSGPDLPQTALALLKRLRSEIDIATKNRRPWQIVIDDARANGQRLWAALNQPERRRLLRHLRTYWDVHRYRVAPQVEAILTRKRADATLRVLPASLITARREADKLKISLRLRGAAGTQEHLSVDKIILTTGPAHAAAIQQCPALRSLAQHGLIQADALGLGIAVNPRSEAVRPDGSSDPSLLVAGPLARGHYGELMGMPQIAGHAMAIAEHVAGKQALLF